MDTVKVGKFIAERRKAQGMTQLELASKLHITDKAVSKWERGICCPDISTLPQLSEELSVSISEILKGELIDSVSLSLADGLLHDSVSTYTKETRQQAWKYMLENLFILFIVIALAFSIIHSVKTSQVDELKVAYIDTYSSLIEGVVDNAYILEDGLSENVNEYNEYLYNLSLSENAITRLQQHSRSDAQIIECCNALSNDWNILYECAENATIVNNSITLKDEDRQRFRSSLLQIKENYLKLEKRMEELGYLTYYTPATSPSNSADTPSAQG